MQKMYSTTMTNTGGRSGEVSAPDGSLHLQIVPPGTDAEGATNPEQLFAAGYSSCFNGALNLVMLRQRIKAESTVSATVSLYDRDKQDFIIGVEIEGHIEGLSEEKTLELLKEAHEVCPYSKATRGNIEVHLKAV
ncbi:organic hydroperoxide resistance protein [Ruminococcaceae bacterium OttesenSCG-928-I18]|nr:organic hydroperoxide resistance protein [Ruminococcaceae bacterium OttesenSCG-928-I18]